MLYDGVARYYLKKVVSNIEVALILGGVQYNTRLVCLHVRVILFPMGWQHQRE